MAGVLTPSMNNSFNRKGVLKNFFEGISTEAKAQKLEIKQIEIDELTALGEELIELIEKAVTLEINGMSATEADVKIEQIKSLERNDIFTLKDTNIAIEHIQEQIRKVNEQYFGVEVISVPVEETKSKVNKRVMAILLAVTITASTIATGAVLLKDKIFGVSVDADPTAGLKPVATQGELPSQSIDPTKVIAKDDEEKDTEEVQVQNSIEMNKKLEITSQYVIEQLTEMGEVGALADWNALDENDHKELVGYMVEYQTENENTYTFKDAYIFAAQKYMARLEADTAKTDEQLAQEKAETATEEEKLKQSEEDLADAKAKTQRLEEANDATK